MSAVSAMLECPSMSWTTFRPAPAAGLCQAGRAVPEIMQADRRQACSLGEPPEVPGQPVRGHRVTVQAGEHIAAVTVASARPGLLGLLAGPVRPQGRHRGAIQRDDPLAAGRLERAQHDMAAVLLQLPGDDRSGSVEVDVAPAQAAGLTAAAVRCGSGRSISS